MSAQHQFSPGEVRREHTYLEFLVRVGEILDSSLDYKQTLGNISEAAVQTIADICFVVLDHGELHVAAAAHRDPAKKADVKTLRAILNMDPPSPEHPIRQVLSSKEPVLMTHVTEARIRELALNQRHAEFMRSMEYASLMLLPLNSKTQGTLGALTLVRIGPDRRRMIMPT